MNILFLGPENCKIETYLRNAHENIVRFEEPIEQLGEGIIQRSDFIVCFGYRYIIPEILLERFKQRAINLHISYLPWNRGADPNLWSFLENTPKGVTIHYLAKKLDAGEILVQREVFFDNSVETLRSTYAKLKSAMEDLFCETWGDIALGKIVASKQIGNGSYHRMDDKEKYRHFLTKEWDTPVSEIIGKALMGGGK